MYFDGILTGQPASRPASQPTVTQRDIGVTLCHAPLDGGLEGPR